MARDNLNPISLSDAPHGRTAARGDCLRARGTPESDHTPGGTDPSPGAFASTAGASPGATSREAQSRVAKKLNRPDERASRFGVPGLDPKDVRLCWAQARSDAAGLPRETPEGARALWLAMNALVRLCSLAGVSRRDLAARLGVKPSTLEARMNAGKGRPWSGAEVGAALFGGGAPRGVREHVLARLLAAQGLTLVRDGRAAPDRQPLPVQLVEMQRIMRHRDLKTTMKIYARAGRLEAFGAMRKLDEYVRSQAC